MNSEKPTQEELQKGYRVCKCGHGVELFEAGFDVKLQPCAACFKFVADREEFFNLPAKLMSK